MLYQRISNCDFCGQRVLLDSVKHTLTCGCGVSEAKFVNFKAFKPVPKYASHITQKMVLPVDSVAYFVDGQMHISDKSCDEEPAMRVSYIHYPKEQRVQARLAFTGNFHVEQLAYNVKPSSAWIEKCWVILNPDSAMQLATYLLNFKPVVKNPVGSLHEIL